MAQGTASVPMRMYERMYEHTCALVCVCIYIHTCNTRTYTYVYVIYIYIYIYIYTYIYAQLRMHTQLPSGTSKFDKFQTGSFVAMHSCNRCCTDSEDAICCNSSLSFSIFSFAYMYVCMCEYMYVCVFVSSVFLTSDSLCMHACVCACMCTVYQSPHRQTHE
jgi:hypothetical protein